MAKKKTSAQYHIQKTTIGVLDLQGDVLEHLDHLARIGIKGQPVKTSADFSNLAGLIIPGGESTTIGKLAKSAGLAEPLRLLEQVEDDIARLKTRREAYRSPDIRAALADEIKRLGDEIHRSEHEADAIKDEIREGRSFRSAVPRGWARARKTILSGNAVSFLAAAVLYVLAVLAVAIVWGAVYAVPVAVASMLKTWLVAWLPPASM